MDIVEIIFKGIEIIFIIIVGVGLFKFRDAYRSQKGVNSAMKEDVKEIEQIIKSVEQKFQRQDKALTAKLNQISGFKEQQRQAIIDYHDQVQKTRTLIDYPDTSSKERTKESNRVISLSYSELVAARNKMRLLNIDDDLYTAALDLDEITLKSIEHVRAHIYVLERYQTLREMPVPARAEESKALREGITLAQMECSKSLEVMNKEITALLKPRSDALETFQKHARRVISELSSFDDNIEEGK